MEKLKILILEDRIYPRMHLSRIVVKQGYEVVGAVATLKEAKEVFRKNKPHIALLDVEIHKDPEAGVNFGKFINRTRPIPIIYITGYPKRVVSKGLSTLPANIIIKPFEEIHVGTALASVAHQHYGLVKKYANVQFQLHMLRLKERDIWEIVYKRDIVYLQASNNDALVFVHKKREKFLVGENCYLVCGISLHQFLNCLPPQHFGQTHRSYAVAFRQIQFLLKDKVIMRNNAEIPLSITYRKRFKYAYDKWEGEQTEEEDEQRNCSKAKRSPAECRTARRLT